MKRVILTELFKLPNRTNFILLIIAALAMTAITTTAFATMNDGMSKDAFSSVISIQLSPISLIISLFIILNIGQEYKDGTLRKNIIDGYNRNDFYIGKITLILLSVFSILILSIIITSIAAISFRHSDLLGYILSLQTISTSFITLSYTALFASFLIFIFKRTTVAIVFYFLWEIVENILGGIYSLISNYYGKGNLIDLTDFLPKSSIKMIVVPFDIIEPIHVITSSIYILIMLFLPYYLFQKANIKP